MRDVAADILEFSRERPVWQRDALRRIFASGELSSKDFEELAELCKASNGLADPVPVKPLSEEHVATHTAASAAVSLLSITHHNGVNALAAEQTVSFAPKLTIVFGENAAGKSGYTRILKRACRSRGIEEILGNVLVAQAPLKPSATIRFREGDREGSFVWGANVVSPMELSGVSVFDSYSAPVYLKDKTDVAFRPFGLDVFDRLSNACGQVRTILETERAKLQSTAINLPNLPAGTRAKTALDNLTALTKVEVLTELAEFSVGEQQRLKELRERVQDLKSSNPKQRAGELKLKSDRFKRLMEHVDRIGSVFSNSKIETLRAAVASVQSSAQAVLLVQKVVSTGNVLPRTGEPTWKGMWDSAVVFAQAAYPSHAFPSEWPDARCPLCQQPIGADAASRLQHFAEFVASRAQEDARKAATSYSTESNPVETTAIKAPDINPLLAELTEQDSVLGQKVESFLDEAHVLQETAKAAGLELERYPSKGVNAGPVGELLAAVNALKERATTLEKADTSLDAASALELSELESRVAFKSAMNVILSEIERKKRLNAYVQCIDDTATAGITRKSTELTKELVTEQLRQAFQTELSRIGFTHLTVELQVAGGTKGALFHRLGFSSAPNVPVNEVVSEGESRTLALAAFLTELSTASVRSGIIFDDPVSSLDHIWREKIARRLVTEAAIRQVIVFTHDLLFLGFLMEESKRQGINCEHQHVRRDGNAGLCSPDLPWIAMKVKARIGVLRTRWVVAEKIYRIEGSAAYEPHAREIYGFLRETWERGIPEVLLNDVVERYRHSIETRKMRMLSDIEDADCKAVEEGMRECSRWIRGHDQAAADGTPVPPPAELNQQIDNLDAWRTTINKRRDKVQ